MTFASDSAVRIRLKHGREKPIVMGHPWVFSGAIARCEGEAGPGAPCIVEASSGATLGHGYYNPNSSIAVRMLTREDIPFTEEILRCRIEQAVGNRRQVLDAGTNVCRLINSEGDFIPGLIVDLYGDGVCMQILTAGMGRFREAIVSCLCSLLDPRFVYERSDASVLKQEGCAKRCELVCGSIPGSLVVRENGLEFVVDVQHGQKTGMFLDQRQNRALVREYAKGRTVADCFAYTGGFSAYALAGGAQRVKTIDSSKKALLWAKENRRLNGFAAPDDDFAGADVFDYLRECGDRYSLIVLDPPKFAKHNRDVDKACRGYKDINLLAMRNIAEGGVVFTFSCSQAVDMKLFRQVVFSAAADSRRSVQLLHTLSQPPDHPVNVAHREGEYLKGLILRVA